MVVLDASALLALLFSEPGADRVAAAIPYACVSSVNLCETLTRVGRLQRDAAIIVRKVLAWPVEWVPFGVDDAYRAADLASSGLAPALSLGDRACLALAHARKLPVLTADRAWLRLKLDIEIELLR